MKDNLIIVPAFIFFHLLDKYFQESSEDEEEIDELVEEDRVAFDDQLLSIGAISRQITEHSIPLVTRYGQES